MLIYLLRHGLTAYNAEKRYQGQRDIPLSPCGPRSAAAGGSPAGNGLYHSALPHPADR